MHEVNFPIEVEIKLQVDEKIIALLLNKLGKANWVTQENIIYGTHNGFVRFRKEEGRVTLTVKGKRSSDAKYNERSEIECDLPMDFFQKILDSGCDGAIVYQKQRASYGYNGCTVFLDNLNGQYFVEIEGTKEGIQKNLRELRLTEFPLETRDYAQIVVERRKNG